MRGGESIAYSGRSSGRTTELTKVSFLLNVSCEMDLDLQGGGSGCQPGDAIAGVDDLDGVDNV